MSLIIVRHGNTFEKNEIPVRIGIRTDKELTNVGRDQLHQAATRMRDYLSKDLQSFIFTSKLQRAYESAQILKTNLSLDVNLRLLWALMEIDHLEDEGTTDSDLTIKYGSNVLNMWDKKGLAPPSWRTHSFFRLYYWKIFFTLFDINRTNLLLVTSNGAARFIIKSLKLNVEDYKLATGKFVVVEKRNKDYFVKKWES